MSVGAIHPPTKVGGLLAPTLMTAKLRGWLSLARQRATGPHTATTIAVAIVIAGVGARAWLASRWALRNLDFRWYASMARSALAFHDFMTPNGTVMHHFPPLFPILLAPFAWLPDDSLVIVAAILSGACALGAWALTHQIYGPSAALVVAAIMGLAPAFVQNASQGYSECVVALVYAVTVYALVRDAREPDRNWILLAGAGAGLTYLAKASFGPFFALAALAGIAWRLAHRGPRGVISGDYVKAASIAAAIATPWIARNVLDFGWAGWDTQPEIMTDVLTAAHAPGNMAVDCFLLLAGMLGAAFVCLTPALVSTGSTQPLSPRSEEGSLLLVAGILPLLTGAVIAAGFVATHQAVEPARYAIPSVVPLAWYTMSGRRPPAHNYWGIAAAILLFASELNTWLNFPFRP